SFNGAASRRRRRVEDLVLPRAGLEASMGPPPEGGGEVRRTRVQIGAAPLQWGRLPKEAERDLVRGHRDVRGRASMGPPPEGGGEQEQIELDRRGGTEASMGPPPEGGG